MIVYFSMLEDASDRDVFQKLYDENKQMLYHIAFKILHNEADAEDAVHTCFVKMAESFARYRHLPYDDLVKLCCTIVRHTATDIGREYAKKTFYHDEMGQGEDQVPDMSPDILDQMIERYEKHLIKQALMELTEDERELLYLQYGLGLKPKEIATLLDKPPQAVRKKMMRCRNKLAKILEGEDYECLR